MFTDAEKFKAEAGSRNESQLRMDQRDIALNVKTTIDDEQVKDNISEYYMSTIIDKCDEAFKWLDANQFGDVLTGG